MKKTLLVLATLVTGFTGWSVVASEQVEEKEVAAVETTGECEEGYVRAEDLSCIPTKYWGSEEERIYATENFLVTGYTDDGNLESVPLDIENSNAKNGYILDPEYNVGDIVEVTYNNDYIMSDRLVTGDELEKIILDHTEVIGGGFDEFEGCEYGYIWAEDFSCVAID